jgi:hypothetical protein
VAAVTSTVQVFRAAVLLVLGAFFVLPLLAMLEFSTRGTLAAAATSTPGGPSATTRCSSTPSSRRCSWPS